MKNFEIESMKDQIHFGKTKEYFEEVLTSYQVGSYRSSVVMLWAVAISDIVYKLQYLVDLYSDVAAEEILDEVRSIQSEDARSSKWELGIVDQVFNKTNLIDSAEYENIRYLQKQRHLCAHPVLRGNLELHKPNKETVRSLIRNTLEGLLIKPPFYTQKVISEILEDLDESKEALNTRDKVKKYIESRYLNRMTDEVEFSLYRTLWKLTFKVANDKCNENRLLNLNVIGVITNRHKNKLAELISADQDYYSNIASNGLPLDYIVHYLSMNESFYGLLTEDAKLKIQHASESTDVGRTCGWFTRGDLSNHFDYLTTWIEGEAHPNFSESQWKYLLELSDSEEWEMQYAKLISSYYCCSGGFNTADSRFANCLLPNLQYFNQEAAEYLLQKIESNNQLYRRNRASLDHKKVRESFNIFFPSDFDYSLYPHFDENTRPVE
ncbi:hypothetical protein [Photobacterium iliopiscarium]|uniref:hypothetical protein n=1 Tax=Photobacterium iliopiscarium TaxID=56192 RepID=UPI0005D449E2|nr:hypothetical protein [Photobacterium iliopiscarium]KJG14546.1 hypothetical protein UB38_02845 [Photobacterium iliopiscarium]PST99300.1 hypothetical protein C9I85_12210 [Photobacterium iliopiscarium]PSV84926.1 hypothetical protein C9J51_01200 [Photobacterium iliopiscarium]USN27423.1 hypothetical protein [synthetic construct]